jgi:hypothetical protein
MAAMTSFRPDVRRRSLVACLLPRCGYPIKKSPVFAMSGRSHCAAATLPRAWLRQRFSGDVLLRSIRPSVQLSKSSLL